MRASRKTSFLPAALLALLAAAQAWPQQQGPRGPELVPLRRFALVAGSNDGGQDRGKLKYAASDARSFASVLKDLGGVQAADLVLLVDPDLAGFRSAMGRMQQMVSSARQGQERRELVVYYSGHSDEDGLILGAERFAYESFRRDINEIPADVRVAILDSCASGALTRAKGGVTRPAFLFDAASDMKGHAFLTSSSAEEAAQESDRIGASFFTHFLVSGLRGAADTTGDGLVTLNEAYAFAFQETLASTERTQFGAQHPAYDISLTGSGDLVLTDLRASSAGLTIPEGIEGRLSIRDEHGALAVELAKSAAQRVDLGLSPGLYTVLLDDRGRRSGAEVRVSAGRRTALAASQLRLVTGDRTVARGDQDPDFSTGFGSDEGDSTIPGAEEAFAEPDASPQGREGRGSGSAEEPAAETAREQPLAVEPFHLALLPEFSFRTSRGVSINMLIGSAAYSTVFAAGGIANLVSRDATGGQAAGVANLVLRDVTGMQFAGVVNAAGRDAGWLQASGVLNFCGGELSGVQAAGVGNLALAGGRGAQAGGVFAIAGGEFAGAQVSGVINWAQGRMQGAQVSGAFNYAQTLSGPQISVVNIAGTVNGAQVGVVNIAGTVTGTQVGVVNISRRIDGVPFGLVTIAGNGRQSLEYWSDTDGTQNAGFSLGSTHTWTLFSAGWVPDTERWSYGIGLGGTLGAGKAFLDLDGSFVTLHESFDDWMVSGPGTSIVRARVMAGMRLLGKLSVKAGLGLGIHVPGMSPSPDGQPLGETRVVPSFLFGVQI